MARPSPALWLFGLRFHRSACSRPRHCFGHTINGGQGGGANRYFREESTTPWGRLPRSLGGTADGAEHYNRRSDRAFTSPLSCRTISVVLRISGSLKATPMVDAIERSPALSSR